MNVKGGKNNFIFIISQPRSGSTLLQSILSNNELVSTTSEPWLLLPFLSFWEPRLQNGIFNSRLAKLGIEDYVNKYDIKNYFKKELREFLLRLYQPLANEQTKYILDKTPRYYEILDLIIDFFPDAKIIILKRNPLDVLKSIITTWDVKNFSKLSVYSRDILYAPFAIQKFIDKNRANKNVLVTFYEKLTQYPESEVQKIYSWLGLNYQPKVLQYKENKKIEGVMGDKVGLYKYHKITHQGMKEKPKQFSDFWEKFFLGYLDYLNPDFLFKYGNYSYNKMGKTSAFRLFLWSNRIEYYKNRQLNIKDLLIFLLLKTKLKFISEYK